MLETKLRKPSQSVVQRKPIHWCSGVYFLFCSHFNEHLLFTWFILDCLGGFSWLNCVTVGKDEVLKLP